MLTQGTQPVIYTYNNVYFFKKLRFFFQVLIIYPYYRYFFMLHNNLNNLYYLSDWVHYKKLPMLKKFRNRFVMRVANNTTTLIKIITRFKDRFKFNYFTASIFLRYSYLNYYSIQRKKLTTVNKQYSYIRTHYSNFTFFLPNYKKKLKKNWAFLIGGLISPFYWDFTKKRKWLRRSTRFSLSNNFNFYKFTKLMGSELIKNQSIDQDVVKQVYFNNFYYFTKLDLNLTDLKYLARIFITKGSSTTSDWAIMRPYLFLNNSPMHYRSYYFQNKFVLSLYRTYKKLFKIARRRGPKNKIWCGIWFKNFSHTRLFSQFKSTTMRPLLRSHFKNTISLPVYYNPSSVSFLRLGALYTSSTSSTDLRQRVYSLDNAKKLSLLASPSILRKFRFFRRRNPMILLQNVIKRSVLKRNSYKLFQSFLGFGRIRTKLTYLVHKHIKFVRDVLRIRKIYPKKVKKLVLASLAWRFIRLSPTINVFSILEKDLGVFFISSHKNFLSLNPLLKKANLRLSCRGFYFENSRLVNFAAKGSSLLRNRRVKSFVFSFLKLPVIMSKYSSNFTGSRFSFLYTTGSFYINYVSRKVKKLYTIKKIMFSFANKYDTHRYILKKYVKNRAASLAHLKPRRGVFKLKTRFPVDSFYSSPLSGLFMGPGFNNDSLFSSVSSLKNLIYKRLSSPRWTAYGNNLVSRAFFNNRQVNFNIRRVRLKPGYMNIWRNARKVLKKSMNLKYKYQHRLTRYITRFKNFLHFRFYLNLEMKLVNLLIKSRLVFDITNAELFINNGLVFVNGLNCYNTDFQIYKGDFIQLIINIKYYIMFRWFTNWIQRRRLRLRAKSRIKALTYTHSDEKQRSRTLPSWIMFNKHMIEDVAKFLEVDYTTLSVFVLYEPFLWSDINSFNIIGTRYGIMNMYNWKYIT